MPTQWAAAFNYRDDTPVTGVTAAVKLASQPKIEWEPNVSTFEVSNVLVTCD